MGIRESLGFSLKRVRGFPAQSPGSSTRGRGAKEEGRRGLQYKMTNRNIKITGAYQNNLKKVDIEIPINRMTAITGVSGSGKSSLAFDTLYAEGQRRYVETFSPYARQFMDRMDRPKVEKIENIPPAIAIDRKDPVRTSRSTVGTMTEVTDYVKLLFARFGELLCDRCGKTVSADTPENVWKWLETLEEGTPVVIAFPYSLGGRAVSEVRKNLLKLGFDRIWRPGGPVDIQQELVANPGENLRVMVDRIRLKTAQRKRVVDSLEMAFRFGNGRVDIISGQEETIRSFSRSLSCADCGIDYPPAVENLFSFNSPVGACESCRGFGRKIDIDLDLIIPDPALTLAQGAIKPWGGQKERRFEFRDLTRHCHKNGIPLDVPFEKLKPGWKKTIVDGTDDYYGIRGFFEWLETKKYKMHVRVFLSRYRSYDVCPDCDGSRFNLEAMRYRLGGKSISGIYAMDVDAALAFFKELGVADADPAGKLVLDEVRGRLKYLVDVGVGYLTLDRQSRTLSGGEVQRVALASSLGASLVNTLYILDEPSIGLHPRDSHRLVRILKKLRDLENTVVIVEHDLDIVRSSDYLIDMGPGAGENGGRAMYAGPTARARSSLTGKYLTGKMKIPVPGARRKFQKGNYIRVLKAAENNLKKITVQIPLALFVCITGVSGSGKSTFAEEILYKAVKRAKGSPEERPGRHGGIEGVEKISDVVMVDQRAIGRTPRANLLTYTGALTGVRKLLADTPEAIAAGYGAGHFSFNVPGGRCETCKGEGFELVEMQFLSDVFIPCPICGGKRFKDGVLGIRYQGKNIHDILEMTVTEAFDFFPEGSSILVALAPVAVVGLGYMRLGQPLNTLSGGEAQRLKLSRHLKQTKDRNTLFIFDEPTTGLHLEDIGVLLTAFQKLVDLGNSLLVIEHNMEVIKSADWVIDLGPEGGDRGGQVVAVGPPEDIASCSTSHTGRFLKPYLDGRPVPVKPPIRKAAKKPQKARKDASVIDIRGAREHNLKNISLSILRNRLVVMTGISGSGKSSLAFDILFAEGRRRYLESLTPYVRQFLGVMERPEVDVVTGLPPAVAIEQRISHAGRRSTVATLTEIYHFLRLLYSKLGTAHCSGCGRPLETSPPDALREMIAKKFGQKSAVVLTPLVSGRKGYHKDLLAKAYKNGSRRARIDGVLTDLTANMSLSRYHEHTIELVSGSFPSENPLDVASKAIEAGKGILLVVDVEGNETFFSASGICPTCGVGVVSPDPRLFSFNSPQGKCSKCDGLGRIGSSESASERVCPECGGSRLRKEALSVKIYGKSLWDLVRMPAGDLEKELQGWSFPEELFPISHPIMEEVRGRIACLNRLGLGYLSLDRSGDTLSGGEGQRVRLAAQLGSNLTGVLYVLDEPTIGLHPRDNHLLLTALHRLRDGGNTVLVVEHDEETIRRADVVIELGPGGGQGGGKVVAKGSPKVLGRHLNSALHAVSAVQSRKRPYLDRPVISVRQARANNLRNLDVDFPLNTLIAVTGVSGSGKSTLVKTILLRGIQVRMKRKKKPENTSREITGWQHLQRVLEVDHSPIGRTPRSVPASYIGFLTEIRKLFSRSPEARAKGYGPARFSFNVQGGRCEACRGQGIPKVEMSFLPDVYVPCHVCGGSRFNMETLGVRYKDKTISQVLDMTFQEAAEFFAPVPSIGRATKLVCDIGLGYLNLGQPSPTLSGGEAQRIKLAEQLVKRRTGNTLYVLDEPTTGLHSKDIRKLIDVLQKIVDQGDTVIAVEHNMEFIQTADYIIDLGPEGGKYGGQLVAAGSPEELMKLKKGSHTALFLKKQNELNQNQQTED